MTEAPVRSVFALSRQVQVGIVSAIALVAWVNGAHRLLPGRLGPWARRLRAPMMNVSSVATDSEGHIWCALPRDQRVQEYLASGEIRRSFWIPSNRSGVEVAVLAGDVLEIASRSWPAPRYFTRDGAPAGRPSHGPRDRDSVGAAPEGTPPTAITSWKSDSFGTTIWFRRTDGAIGSIASTWYEVLSSGGPITFLALGAIFSAWAWVQRRPAGPGAR